MTIEDDLRRSLAQQAEAVRPDDAAWVRLQLEPRPQPRRRLPSVPLMAAAALTIVVAVGAVAVDRASRRANLLTGRRTTGPAQSIDSANDLPAARAGAGPRVLVSSNGLHILDVPSGVLSPVPAVAAPPHGEFDFGIVHVKGGYVVVERPDGTPSPGRVYFLRSGLASPAVELGSATSVFRSLSPGRIWLVDQQTGEAGPLDSTVQEVDTTAPRLSRVWTLPCCGQPVADVDGGIVMLMNDGRLVVWSLQLNRARHTFPNALFLGATARTLLWAPRTCAEAGGPVHRFDLDAGRDRLATSRDSCFEDGSIGPDGRTAVIWTHGDGAGVLPKTLDVDTGVVTPLDTPPLTYRTVIWEPGGGFLFFDDVQGRLVRGFRGTRLAAPIGPEIDVKTRFADRAEP